MKVINITVENLNKMSLENPFQNNIFDKEKLFKTLGIMKKSKIKNSFDMLDRIILEKNSEVVSLIETSANLESKFKKFLKQNELGVVNESELIAIEKKLNTIIRKNFTKK